MVYNIQWEKSERSLKKHRVQDYGNHHSPSTLQDEKFIIHKIINNKE